MYERWVSIHAFRWTPILTFTRRHLALLDWLEENVQPVAFLDEPQTIGIAIGASDLRLTVSRAGMTIESGLSGLPVNRVVPALEGVFDLLQPKATILTVSNVVSTRELPGTDYDEMRRAFAIDVAGVPSEVAELSALDGSSLVDLESDQQSAQVEWGIVEADELLMRLSNPKVSRIVRGRSGEEPRPKRQLVRSQIPRSLPEVSVFAELVITRLAGGAVTDAQSVSDIIEKVEDTAKTVTLSFADRFDTTGNAVSKEGATW
ncbi:hypothetical protein [Mycobacterium helveticum]|uniref:Uncharacterized protein n=1 Tax=Mycobacterium helveticum TaxID=2592811 RepID=A0A557WWK8_9MYCO|nr:hypothetical protein [Mycobacterium helveticum]TVS77000.1 hypothetical protein FPZ46_26615 [Mycobacterium helveticum]TVS77645.1 hypothetical protein FPZ47_26590 [Mycobacterium helveticum]